MPCPEHIDNIAHVLSDTTDLDPVSVCKLPFPDDPVRPAWKIEGMRDGACIVRIIVHNDGTLYAGWDPERHITRLQFEGVL